MQKNGPIFSILLALSFCHLINDMIQSLLPAIYPILRKNYHLNFTQIGMITFAYQLTASLLQPFVGGYTDKYPKPYSLSFGMFFTLSGLLLLANASDFYMLMLAASITGIGTSIFHPESSRIARLASGGKHGSAQSIFQVGGNAGTAIGPLLAAFIILRNGQGSIAWFAIAALLAIIILFQIGKWYSRHLSDRKTTKAPPKQGHHLSRHKVILYFSLLMILVFSKYFYMISMTSYYTFYLIDRFGLSVKQAQLHLFIFLGAIALGTLAGGPLGDKIGRKYVILFSLFGVMPFTLMLPYANLWQTEILSFIIGVVLASAFSAILVYATDLIPGRVGAVSGFFYGFAFGMGAIAAAILGKLADMTSIGFVFHICSYLPAIGIMGMWLPDLQKSRRHFLNPIPVS